MMRILDVDLNSQFIAPQPLQYYGVEKCDCCGKTQYQQWMVTDEAWKVIPKKYWKKAICLECFVDLYEKSKNRKRDLSPQDFQFMSLALRDSTIVFFQV